MHAKEGRVSIYLCFGAVFPFLAIHMISSILVFCYTKFCLFWFFLGMIYFPNFKMTKHVFLEGKNLKYPPTNQRRDHLLEVFGAIRLGPFQTFEHHRRMQSRSDIQ